MTRKSALITGVTGQDGSFMAQTLLEKGYEVHDIKRRASSFNTQRVDYLYEDIHEPQFKFRLHYGALPDSSNFPRLIQETQTDAIHNLAAQGQMAVSFESPERTGDIDGVGILQLLEAMRILRMQKTTRFHRASTSELYGLVEQVPQTEAPLFYPRNPYPVTKLYVDGITFNYRELYGMYACNGILCIHESPRRGETFVTRNLTLALCNIAHGHGFTIEWSGAHVNEVGRVANVATAESERCNTLKPGQAIIESEPRFSRPTGIRTRLGAGSTANGQLGWQLEISVEAMCERVIESHLHEAQRAVLIRKANLHR